jgi:hypothetical protein
MEGEGVRRGAEGVTREGGLLTGGKVGRVSPALPERPVCSRAPVLLVMLQVPVTVRLSSAVPALTS